MIIRIAAPLLLLFQTAAALGQEALAIRIETTQEGLHRIPGEAIKAYYPLDRIVPDRLALTHDGDAVPIEVFGASDGHFDPSDEIIFFAERPRFRHSKTETYVLTERGRAARLKPTTTNPGGDASIDAQVVVHTQKSAVFDQLATVRQDVIRGTPRSPWFSAAIVPRGAVRRRSDRSDSDPSTASIPVLLDPRPSKGLPARIRINAFGAMANGVPQKLAINVNGTDLAPQSWDTPLEQVLVVTIPPDVLRRETVVRFTNLSDVVAYPEPGNEIMSHRRNDLLISSFDLIYDAQLAGPSVSGQQLVFHIAPTDSNKPRQLRFEQRQREGYLIVEPKSGRLWRGPIVEVPSDREVTLAVCSLGGSYLPSPAQVQPLRITKEHITGQGADYVIVTTSDLKPAVAMLADHRRADGLTPIVIEARELYDTFTNGAFHPSAIQKFLVAATLNWPKKPRYLLLVGDADLDVNFVNEREPLPSWLVMTDYNGMTGTDALHVDLDADGLPDIPVGRIPTRTREDFLKVARRIIALDAAPPSGPWRRRITFFAGEGRFGPFVDKLLENQAAQVISAIPPEFDVQMTYGSPTSDWYWPAEDFNAHLIQSFNAGSLVFTYLGHGSPEAFDHVSCGSSVYPILSVKDIDSLQDEGRSPVMAIIACSTGYFDDPNRDCIAEKMFMKDGGPIAVVAASRISHPYPNALLGKGIATPFFDRTNRVGDAFRAGTLAMLKESKLLQMKMLSKAFLSKAVNDETLVRDHVYIYNLIGDPAQHVPFPSALASIESPETAKAGSQVAIVASVANGTTAEAVVSIEASRARKVRSKAESEPTNAGAEERGSPSAEAVRTRHDMANDHAIARGRFKVEGGVLKASLDVPAGTPPGVYSIVIFVEGSADTPDAAGSRKIMIE